MQSGARSLAFRNAEEEPPYETGFSPPIFDRTYKRTCLPSIGELASLRVARRLIIRSARKMQKIVWITAPREREREREIRIARIFESENIFEIGARDRDGSPPPADSSRSRGVRVSSKISRA